MIKRRADFLHAQKKGRRIGSHGLVLQAVKNDQELRRTGFTVTKKVDKRAVVRNRIRRRLKAVAADVLPLHAANGFDYVLIGKAATRTRPYHQLAGDLKWCLKKLELYEDEELSC